MHSSRMHTAQSLSYGGLCDRDPPDRDPLKPGQRPSSNLDRDPPPTWTETLLQPGQRPPSNLDRDPPPTLTETSPPGQRPPVNRITDRCKKTLPFPILRLRAVTRLAIMPRLPILCVSEKSKCNGSFTLHGRRTGTGTMNRSLNNNKQWVLVPLHVSD